MKASETILRNLLEGGKQFRIPLFQRPYSWKKENWETLWEDLMNLYKDDGKNSYFLGPIVTQAELGTADGITPYIVIDGQQRLTTLSILLAALRNFFKKHDKQASEQIYEFYLINKYQNNDDLYKVLPTQDDREIYRSIIQSKMTKDRKKEGQIYEAYKFFDNKLKKPDLDEDFSLDYTKFKNLILEKLVLVNITTDSNDNPYLIFESLNNKGEELTQADLVRNYIFMKLPNEEQDELYNNEWAPLEKSFKSKLEPKVYAEEIETALWYYIRKDGNSVTKKEIYKTIRNRFDNFKDINTFKSEIKNLVKFVQYYQRLNLYEEEPQESLNYWFQRFKRLNFKTCHVFILNIYQDYEDQKISLHDFKQILNYIESYFVRRLFCDVSTNILGKVFDNLYSEVKNANAKNLLEGLRTVLRSYDKTKIFPDDDSFRKGIINESIYTKSLSDRTKLILETIESSLTKEKVNFDDLEVEHIMPQKLRKEWEKTLGENYSAIHKKWLNTLGNLTLTGYNPELSNKPFDIKVNLLRESNVSLNRYFHKLEAWNEIMIKKRAESLADIAIKIWPR